jgi:pimeloyl-[acyl-carrier protein] methyl ester esterase
MADRFTVLGGWGISPDVLRPVFGDASTYIDVNGLMPLIIEKRTLRIDWREIIAAAIRRSISPPGLLAGWSTGAILAAACAPLLPVRGLVLLSATPSFCRTATFKYGLRSSVLHTMRERLSVDPDTVIDDFRKQCGLPGAAPRPLFYPAGELAAGLDALQQMSLFDQHDTIGPAIIFHGRNDRIIPAAAGEFLSVRSGGTFVSLNGTHACFINNSEIIKSSIFTFIKGIDHGPV